MIKIQKKLKEGFQLIYQLKKWVNHNCLLQDTFYKKVKDSYCMIKIFLRHFKIVQTKIAS